jgi:hypothetical protein
MQHFYKKFIACVFFLIAFLFTKAQNNFFTDVAARPVNPGETKTVVPNKSRNLLLDTAAVLNFFKTFPAEKSSLKTLPIIIVPMPDGTSAQFRIMESSVMEPTLAAKFPELKTYVGQGVDDSTATIKLDWTSFGFHAMILSPVSGQVFIDPYIQGNKNFYISYFKSDVDPSASFSEQELKENKSPLITSRPAQILSGPQCIGPQLLTYRLAVACTGEYAVAATGLSNPTIAQTLSAILTTVNRVDGVYKTELSIHFVLVANEDHIIFTNGATDPFTDQGTNTSPGLVSEGQTVIDDSIGNANYDVGQTFSKTGGGLSYVGVACQSGYKASSVTGLAVPIGDPFSIDYVAHEIGHEFNALHPFNSKASYCSGQGNFTTNDEPGSGSTIMAYAEGPVASGLCGSDNLQLHSDAYFNGLNFDQITQYVVAGAGNTCAVISPTGNNAPIANAGVSNTIPLGTPFFLTGSATDPDGDPLTYCWEQVDIGGSWCAWNVPVGDAPIFRSFPPSVLPIRYFPQLSDVINETTTIGEVLPLYARTMHFRLTARDNRSTGGGVCFAETSVVVDGASGPFMVTYPTTTNIVWNQKEQQTITWNVANSASSPVNCNSVTILLSIDGGQTFPDTLLANTANTGSAQITVPEELTTQGRIKIASVGNIFYNMSANNFTIQKPPFIITIVKQGTNIAQVSWTVNEFNTSYYNVERSTDDKNFILIGKVISATGNGVQQYNYADTTTQDGINYYRIQQVNTDSSKSYSDTANVSIQSQWKIFPNPADEKINIQCNVDISNVTIALYSITGKLVYKSQLGNIIGNSITVIPVSQFESGIYILKLLSSTVSKTQKVIIK